jgi:tetratricopeptide (TPR) repeat protein
MAVPVVAYILIRQQIFSETSDIYSLGVIDNLMVTAPDGFTRFATAVRILGKYLFYCFIPYQQVSDYSYRQLTLAGISDPYFLVSALVYTGMIIISALFFRKKDIRVFALIFYLVTISIYSNLFFLIGSAFGERFLFLPSLGICILIVMMIIGRASAESSPTQNDIGAFLLRNRIQLILIIALVVAFSVKSFYRSTEWKDSYTLFTADVQRSPNSARLHMQMGTAWRDLARKEQDPVAREALVRRALASYRRSLDLLPSFPEAQEQTGLAWYMLGQIDIAMFYYDMVVKKNPLKAELWNNIGSVWVDRGDLNQALLVFRKVTEINPAYADGWQNIGSVLGRMGRFEEAIPYFYKSIELAPDKALSYQLLSLTFQNLGRPDEAASWQQRAIEIRAAETDL